MCVGVCVSGCLTVCAVLSVSLSRELSEITAHLSITVGTAMGMYCIDTHTYTYTEACMHTQMNLLL